MDNDGVMTTNVYLCSKDISKLSYKSLALIYG